MPLELPMPLGYDGRQLVATAEAEVDVASVLEALMLLSFGLSWPINALKAWKARTAKATSPAFLALITFGYVAGIAAKFVGHNVNWVLGVYLFNLVALIVNDLIYLRNRRLDTQREG